MRRIIRCLLVCLLMLGLLPKSVYADTTYNLTLQGEKAYNMAYEILTLVNQERAKVGAAALQMDTTQLEAAMQRAAECHILYDHTRPDGTKCFTALPTPPGGTSRSENITTGGNSSTARGAVDSWLGSAAHKEAMLNTKYKSTGIGVFYYNGRYMFTEFFSSQTANVPARKYNTSATMTVKANDTRIKMITMNLTSPTVPAGGSSSVQMIMANYRDTVLNPADFTYTSSNTAVATVSSDGVVRGVKKGTASITAYLKGSGKSWTTSVVVDNGVLINETNFPDMNLREFVSRYMFDPDQNGYLTETELKNVTFVRVTDSPVSSLKGIELLPNLGELEITQCTMTEISLTGMPKLTDVILRGTGPVSVTVANNPLLVKLAVTNNTALKQLSVKNCASLERLDAEWLANIEIVQMQNLNKLFDLNLAFSGIKTVDVSSIPLLNTAMAKGTSYVNGNIYPERVSVSYQYSIGDMVYGVRVPRDTTVIASSGTYAGGERTGNAAAGTGLYNLDGTWKYYVNGTFTSATGLVQRPDTGKWYYVQNGIYTKATGLVRRVDNGKWFYVQNGVYTKATGLAKRIDNGKWYYVQNGAYTKATGLARRIDNGKWFYVQDGAYTKATGLARRIDNGKWYYVQNGAYVTATGLARRIDNGKWYYVLKGAYTKFTGVVRRIDNGKYYYVKDGVYTKFTGVAKDAAGYTYTVTSGVAVRR